MLVVWIILFIIVRGNCHEIPISDPTYNDNIKQCVTDVLREHFAEIKTVTFIGNTAEDEDLRRTINNAETVSVISADATKKSIFPHEAYIITSENATYIAETFSNVSREYSWNPLARFLFIIKDLNDGDFKIVFDTFLKLHIRHAVVLHATDKPHLYGYDIFDNYSCGKRYDAIIDHGVCSLAFTNELYPEEFKTGLRNCTFNVIITQWLPYSIWSDDETKITSPIRNGAETYLFNLIAEMQGFKLNIVHDYTTNEEFPTISRDNEAVGMLKKVQDGEADAVLGGMLLTPVRALAFSYLYGHLADNDEIRFAVKRASIVPPWKNIYLEFESTVWVLLLLVFVLYSVLLILLLDTDDKSHVVLVLLANLVQQGHTIKSRLPVKWVLIIWLWSACLINTFYQSALFSLTTNPAREYQISNEEDIARYRLKPCFSKFMEKYYIEAMESSEGYHRIEGCDSVLGSVAKVANSKTLFALITNGQYRYNKHAFLDKHGDHTLVIFARPYSKVTHSLYLYKGFPMVSDLLYSAMLLRELGLTDKAMDDMTYIKQLKYSFHYEEKVFEVYLVIPWRIYIFGCILALVIFIIELNMRKNINVES